MRKTRANGTTRMRFFFTLLPAIATVYLGGGCSGPILSREKTFPTARLVAHEQFIEDHAVPQVSYPSAMSQPVVLPPDSWEPHRRTAVEIVVDLENEIEILRNENQRLRASNRMADDTIEDQAETLSRASAELDKSRRDFEKVQTEMRLWRDRFAHLAQDASDERLSFQEALRRTEQRLQSLLIQLASIEMPSTTPKRRES